VGAFAVGGEDRGQVVAFDLDVLLLARKLGERQEGSARHYSPGPSLEAATRRP